MNLSTNRYDIHTLYKLRPHPHSVFVIFPPMECAPKLYNSSSLNPPLLVYIFTFRIALLVHIK